MTNTLKTACLLSTAFLCFFLSCKKNLSSDAKDAVIANAKSWYLGSLSKDSAEALSSEADWNNAFTTTNGSGGEIVIVPESGGFKISGSTYASNSSFIFFADNSVIKKGFLVQVVGQKEVLQAQGQQVFLKLTENAVDGVKTGAVIVYTVSHKFYQSRAVKDGAMVSGSGVAITKQSDLDLKGYVLVNGVLVQKTSTTKVQVSSVRRMASTMGTQGESNCTDWYMVSYNASTGEEISETYLYTTCENSGGGSTGTSNDAAATPPPCPSSFHFVTKISGSIGDPTYEGGWQVAGISDLHVNFVSLDGESPDVTVTMPTLYFGLPVVKQTGSTYTTYTYEMAQNFAIAAVAKAEQATNNAYLSGVTSSDALAKTYRAALTSAMATFAGTVSPVPGTNITVPAKDLVVADYGGIFGC